MHFQTVCNILLYSHMREQSRILIYKPHISGIRSKLISIFTENGYFSNTSDFNNINSDSANNKKAKAMVRGIADYFISIQYTPVPDDTENNSGTASNPVTSTESKPNTSDVSKPTDTTSSNSDIGPITPPTDSSQGGSSEASSRPDDEPDLNDTTSNSVPEPEE